MKTTGVKRDTVFKRQDLGNYLYIQKKKYFTTFVHNIWAMTLSFNLLSVK